MAKISVVFALVLIWAGLSLALPTPDEERYMDKEYSRDLLDWLASMNPSSANNPCTITVPLPCKRYNSQGFNELHKRNSEVLNSLLGLPKTMHEVGK